MDKTLDNVNIEDAKNKVSDIEVYGDGDSWKLICKASSKKEGWMKSTKAMFVGKGCLVQVTTQQGDNVAEAITYVNSIKIKQDDNGNYKLVPMNYEDHEKVLNKYLA